MPSTLKGKTIAILATDGFEQSELIEPKQALEDAGARTQVVSPTGKNIKGWDKKDWGKEVPVDVPLKSADPGQYDALLLPGGVMNPDQLRMNPDAVRFAKQFFEQGNRSRPSVMGHGCWWKPAQCVGVPLLRGHLCKPTFETRAAPGWTRK